MNAHAASACLLLFVLVLCGGCTPPEPVDTGPRKIEVLFLGHDSEHHNSEQYAPILISALAREGINISYRSDPDDLNPETLALYDALLLYANHDSITTAQEEALLDFVASGKGFLPIHAASYCFRNSDAFVELVGAQFKEHGTGTFTAEILPVEHPVLEGLEPFETWDETYVHDHHNDDRTVLMERVDGDHREPWTWVRTYGDGRIFYTAYGHDERTWSRPGFQALIKNGLLWAVGDDLRARWAQLTFEPFVYEASTSIPNYERRDPPPRLQQPFSPEASQQFIQVPPGFDLQLFAAEPDIVNPIAMAWDERGRLWVLETRDYPNDPQPEDLGHDVLKILEDTDGDGKADSFKVFADKLSIPTSLAFADDGVIVAQAPHFLFLKDTDGDDRADVREVLMTGWGTSDTHAGPSTLKYGLDNWFWGAVGYSDFNGVVGGDSLYFSQGLYRFTPDGQKLESMATFTNNTWGLGFSETFDVFGSTANNEHSVYVAIPNRHYEGVRGLRGKGSKKIDGHYAMHPNTQNVRQVDVFGGFTAAAGFNLYTARSFPASYWNRVALVSEPTGHLLHRAVVEKDGAGFVEQDAWNLLASADEWVSPVHAEVGPDGAVWILDWYNFIVQHNPTPEGFETGAGNAHINPLRDRQHGRIYRLAYRAAPPYTPITLSKDDPDALVEALRHDNMFWRTTAQRLLVERGETDVLDDLYRLVRDRRVDALGLNGAALHALWTMHGLGALDGANEEALAVATAALAHPAAGVRKAAMQVLPKTEAALDALLDAGSLRDADLHTRLAAVLVAAEMPSSATAGAALYEAGKAPDVLADEWLREAVFIAAASHRQGFLDAYAADIGPTTFTDLAARLARGEGDMMAEWSRPDLDDAGWSSIEVPRPWSETDLEDLNGIVWFRTTVTIPAALAGRAARFQAARIDEVDDVWINGTRVGERQSRWWVERDYAVPEGVLQAGDNVIAIRVENARGDGGIVGDPEQLALAVGSSRVPLAGTWRYTVEQTYTSSKPPDVRPDIPIARQFLMHYVDEVISGPSAGATPGAAAEEEEAPALEVALSVVAGQLQFDPPTLTVPAGQRVRITFRNPDDMQHNVLILEPGTTDAVGALADALATRPEAAEQDYVPDTPAVLYASDLVDPRAETTLTFVAPETPGAYPYLCTFPGHWRTMQGTMQVTAP